MEQMEEKVIEEKKVETTAEKVIEPQSEEHGEIIDFFKKIKFRKQTIGGLDERSVWKKLEELNRLYDSAIRAEKIRRTALLDEYKRTLLNEIDNGETTVERLRDFIATGCPASEPAQKSNDEE